MIAVVDSGIVVVEDLEIVQVVDKHRHSDRIGIAVEVALQRPGDSEQDAVIEPYECGDTVAAQVADDSVDKDTRAPVVVSAVAWHVNGPLIGPIDGDKLSLLS